MLNGPAVGRLKLNTPSLRRLAAWRGHRLPPGGGLEPLSIEAQLHFDGWMIALSKLTMALDESTVQGDMVIDAHDAVPVIHGRLKLDHAVLDPYVTPPATQTRPAREGWNTVPVNLSLLKLFAADLHVESGPLSFEGVTIDKAAFDATLKDSVLNIRFPALSLYGGRGTAELRIDAHGRVPAYRGRVAMQLLWRGIAAYVFHYQVDLMFGCASLPGIDPAKHALPLSYLYHFHRAPDGLCPRALPERYVDMRMIAKDEIDQRAALLRLPPLIKGYLRLGGFVGDGAVIDSQFDSTDVFIIVKTELVTEKYMRHYERGAIDKD